MSTITIGLRIDTELLTAVDAEALRQRRSRNQVLCLVIEHWLATSIDKSDWPMRELPRGRKDSKGKPVGQPSFKIPEGVTVVRASELLAPLKHAVNCKCLSCKPPNK